MMTTNSHQDNSIMTASPLNISDHIVSSIDLKSSSFLSPSHNQPVINRKSSSKQITSMVQSPANFISSFEQQESPIPSSSINLHRLSSVKSHLDNRIQSTFPSFNENTDRNRSKKRNNWIDK